MNNFKQAFIVAISTHYHSNPDSYVKSLERTIEIEWDLLVTGMARKDNDVIAAVCKAIGIDNKYISIKRELMRSS